MIKILIKIRNFFSSNRMLFAFAVTYLISAFLNFTFITADTKYLRCLSYIIGIWGIIIIIFCIFNKNKRRINLPTILSLLLIASFAISAMFMYKYGIAENIKGLIWLSLEMIILFAVKKGDISSKYLKYFMIVYVFISTLYTLLSITMAIVGYMHFPTSTIGDTVAGGMAHGRLYGLYSDPNYGAISCILCILSILFLLHNSKSKFNIVISLIIAFLQIIYISLSGSRSGLMAFTIATLVVVFLWMRNIKKKNWVLSFISSILISCFCLSLCIVIEPIYETVEPQILKAIDGPITNPMHLYTVQFADKVRNECGIENPYIKNNGTPENTTTETTYKHGEANSEHIGVLGRNENEDLSNNRYAIWSSSIELFLQSPLIGLSNRNYSDFCLEQLPDNYLSQMRWTSMHNAFIDVLVSQGLIGLVIWICIILLIFISLIKEIKNNKEDSRLIVLLGMYLCLMVMCMFYSELIYINTIGSIFFWYTFSHIRYDKIKKK